MSDKDVFEGKMKQAEGKVQDAFGDLTGSSEQDARGKTKQVEGEVQEGYGRLQNAIHDTLDDDVDDDDI
jgi:uncharacterized protein YjbJ (UPF0337 family)